MTSSSLSVALPQSQGGVGGFGGKFSPSLARETSAARLAKTTPSSRLLLARRLAPCRPVQATSPMANRLRMLVSPFPVGFQPAAKVMGRRDDRDRLFGHVDPEAEAGFVDGRKMSPDEFRALVRDIEKNTVVRPIFSSRCRWREQRYRAEQDLSDGDNRA